MESTSNNLSYRLFIQVGIAVLGRLILNTARRFPYTFVSVLSRGLGVPLTSITSLIAISQVTSIFGILSGPLSDYLGYQRMMVTGLAMLAVGMIFGAFLPFYIFILIAIFLAGLGKTIFDPASLAYFGEKVPLRRRGLIVGLLETSWAGSTLLGIPLIGLFIEKSGWRAPFFIMAGLGIASTLIFRYLIPKDKKELTTSGTSTGFSIPWKQLFCNHAALGALGYAFFLSAANDNLFVVYGAWLEKNFGLTILALGLGTSVIGIAELSGASMTAFLADHLGLKKSVFVGLVITSICYSILPLTEWDLPLSLIGLFFVFTSFEFTIVSSLSLCTELLPNLRATMLAAFFATAGIGRFAGALIGGIVWSSGGLVAISFVSTTINLLAMASLAFGLRSYRH